MKQQPGDLNLRPIPGPEPVPLPDSSAWLWLVPAVLIGFLWYWWSRKPRVLPPSPLEKLKSVLEQAKDPVIPANDRLAQVQAALRQYLAWHHDPAWLVATGSELDAWWSQLLPGDAARAEAWKTRWNDVETYLYDQKTVSREQLGAYVQEVELLTREHPQ